MTGFDKANAYINPDVAAKFREPLDNETGVRLEMSHVVMSHVGIAGGSGGTGIVEENTHEEKQEPRRCPNGRVGIHACGFGFVCSLGTNRA
jgi:hypothetical protein